MRIGRFFATGGAAAVALTLALVAAACAGPEPTATPRPTATPTPEPSPALALVDGWYRGQAVEYYDFGTNSPSSGGAVATAPIWAFITGFDAQGNPQLVQGQHNVVDHVPGEAGYSDLWLVMLVTVPEGYVADTGEGIADDELERVFERSYRSDRSRARSSGGAGLGLAIARGIVEAHGGRIWAQADRERGAEVVFTLPKAGPSSALVSAGR
jgi:hypothetical protein